MLYPIIFSGAPYCTLFSFDWDQGFFKGCFSLRSCDSEESSFLLVRMECPAWGSGWRPEALDCRVRFPPETSNGFTCNPPSVEFEPQTSCI